MDVSPDHVAMLGSQLTNPRTDSGFAAAISAGRDAYRAGPMVVQQFAVPSTPELGLAFSGAADFGRLASQQ